MTASSQAVIVSNVAGSLLLLILCARITFTLWRRERIDAGFVLAVISVLVTIARMVTDGFYLKMGNISDIALSGVHYIDSSDVNDLKTGSKLILLSRALVTTFLWLQISLLLLFYSRITFGISWVAWVVKITWVAVAASFVATILLTFLECRPITLYWQITPNPPHCVQAPGQFFAQTICNIVLDLLLIVIACPIIGLRKRTTGERITLYTLFTLGTFCIMITIVRIIYVCVSDHSIVTRCILASVQMIVSAFVANAPHLYGSIRVLWTNRASARTQTFEPDQHMCPVERERRQKRIDAYNAIDRTYSSPISSNYALRPLFLTNASYDETNTPSPYSPGVTPEG